MDVNETKPRKSRTFFFFKQKKVRALAKPTFWAYIVGPVSSILITGFRFWILPVVKINQPVVRKLIKNSDVTTC